MVTVTYNLASWDASKSSYPCSRASNILHFRLAKYFLPPLWWQSHKKFLMSALHLKTLSPWTKIRMWNGTESYACRVKTQHSTPSKVPPSLCTDESPRAEINYHSVSKVSVLIFYLSIYWTYLKLQVIYFEVWPLGSYTEVPTFLLLTTAKLEVIFRKCV
jgi:hypothetical protein